MQEIKLGKRELTERVERERERKSCARPFRDRGEKGKFELVGMEKNFREAVSRERKRNSLREIYCAFLM